jgi:hypothetical protein
VAVGLLLAGCAAGTVEGQQEPASVLTIEEAPSQESSPAPSCPELARCRAWLLFKVENAPKMAAALEDYLTKGGADYVVVRVDVVEGDYNLVVPVDASSQASLSSLIETLRGIVGSAPVVLVVTEHHPDPVTRSHSFVTGPEAEPYPTDFPESGRQVPNSPGANPWG